MKIEIEVLGEPQAQMRHRSFNRNGISGTYDPSKDIKKDFLLTVQDKAPNEPILGPIMLSVVFYMPRPKNHYGSGKNASCLKDSAPEYHISRPDADNFLKLIFDALNGIFWKDDSQICWVEAQKKYSERPRTHLIIQTL